MRIRVQSVLFQQANFDRLSRAIAQAVTQLHRDLPDAVVDVCLGDCSDEPLLDANDERDFANRLKVGGVASLGVRFFGENLGHGGAQNRLLDDRGDADFVLVLNPDTCLGPSCLRALVATISSDLSIGIVEARQLPLEHQKAYDPKTGDTSWATGACALMRADVFNVVGGFDDGSFFLYCDDVDFSWRCRLAGFRVVHEPSATVFHDKRLSADSSYVPSETEKLHSSLAAVLLAAKYSRPDIAAERLFDLDNSTDPVHTVAASEYRRRVAAGALAQPLDPRGTVAQFQTYAYADLRFDYTIVS